MPKPKSKKRKQRPELLSDQLEQWADEDLSQWTESAAKVRKCYQAVRLKILGRLPGTHKASAGHIRQVQELFSTEVTAFNLSKKVYDPKEPAIKRINEVYAAIIKLFSNPAITMAFPGEKGMRLIREDSITDFDNQMKELAQEMRRATLALARAMSGDRRAEFLARQQARLGDLYDEVDYNFEPSTSYNIVWDFPSVEVPSYLSRLDPKLYEEHDKKLQARFEAAVRRREVEMADELLLITDRLIETLSGVDEDGKPRTFRDATVRKIFEAIDASDKQLAELGIGQGELAGVFGQLKRAVRGMSGDTAARVLRTDDVAFRQRFAERLSAVRESVSGLSILKPRRKLLREEAADAAQTGTS